MKTTPVGGLAWEPDLGQGPRMSANGGHVSVLYQAVLEYLLIKPGGIYLDGTVGAAGHASAILKASSPDGLLLAMDRDPDALSFSGERLAEYGDRVTFVRSSFDQMGEHAARLGYEQIDGILLDLGLSSRQLDDPARGFTFRQDGPLDMRLDPDGELTAASLINGWSQDALADVIHRFGEERDSRRIARAIVAARPVNSTGELAAIVSGAMRRRERNIHPATRTFQAVRIAVNRELEALSLALPQAVRLLRPGGRLVVIAFHSLEDRIVKQFYKREAQDCLCSPDQPVCTCVHQATLEIVTKRPIRPSADEVRINPRSRSARLRVAERK